MLIRSASSSVLRTSKTLPGGDRILLITLTAYGTASPGAVTGHNTKHALYFKFQFSRMICVCVQCGNASAEMNKTIQQLAAPKLCYWRVTENGKNTNSVCILRNIARFCHCVRVCGSVCVCLCACTTKPINRFDSFYFIFVFRRLP